MAREVNMCDECHMNPWWKSDSADEEDEKDLKVIRQIREQREQEKRIGEVKDE